MTDTQDAQEIEFDLLAGWTEDAVQELGPEYAIPAGCRGSGSPADLAWLAEALAVGPETRIADVGSGVGGPAGWLAEHFGATPVCAEPMSVAAAAGRLSTVSVRRRWRLAAATVSMSPSDL